MNLFSAMVFEGGTVPTDDDEVTMDAWTVAEACRVFGEFMGDVEAWAGEKIAWAEPSGPQTLNDTITIVNNNLITAAKCGINGGQLYIVRSA